MKFTTDFFTETYAGFIALYPNSAAAEAWIDANVPPEALTAAGGIAVKPNIWLMPLPRYAPKA
jgi:hypothetical protein